MTLAGIRKHLAAVIVTVAAAFALFFCALAFEDVPRNRMIHDPSSMLWILAGGAGAVVLSVIWTWMRSGRIAYYCGLAVSGLLLLFSLVCLCV